VPVLNEPFVNKTLATGATPFDFSRNFLAPNNATISFKRSNVSTTANVVGDDDLSPKKWHFIVGMKSGSNLRLFIDGAESGNSPVSDIAANVNNTSPINIAYRLTGFPNYTFTVDDVRIYNNAITTGPGSQLEKMYNNGVGEYTSSQAANLVGLWRMDDGNGVTVKNSASNYISPASLVDGTIINPLPESWKVGIVPLGLDGLGTANAFIHYGPQ